MKRIVGFGLAAILAAGFCGSAQAQTPPYVLTKTVALGGGIKWDYLHFDAATNRVYISHGTEITVVDAASGAVVGNVTGLAGSHGIAIDDARGLGYADSALTETITVFSLKSLQKVKTIPALLDADGMVYDAASDQVYNVGGDANAVLAVNAKTGKPAANIALGGAPEFLASDDAGSLYVNINDKNAIVRIDTKTNKIIARWPVAPCESPTGLAIDPATRRVFSTCHSGVMVVLDADTGKIVATLPIGRGTDAASFDPVRNLAFSSNGDGTLSIVKENGPNNFTLLSDMKTAPGARTLAVDPATGRIFLVTATVLSVTPPAGPNDHPHYVFKPGTLKLLIFDPTLHVERVVLLMRHGVRPPTHEPALDPAIAPSPWPVWDVPDGYLTPHGAQAIKLLAAYDRKLFAPAPGCPSIAIYADVDERTVKTGEAYAEGFAPGCKIAVDHAAGATDPLFSALDDGAANFDAKTAQAAMLAAAGGDIAAPVTANAALFRQMQAVLAPGGTAFLQLPAKISVKTPGHLPKLSGPIAEGSSAAEDFLLEYLEGKPMAQVAWGRLDEAGVARLLALHPLAYTITARPAYIADFTAAPLAARILATLTAPGAAQTSILVGHDTNIAELGGLLDMHWSLGGYPADDPPPGGGIIFTLLADAGGAQYVTATYQVQSMDQIRNLTPLSAADPPAMQALPIPGCGNSALPAACTLAAFKALLATKP